MLKIVDAPDVAGMFEAGGPPDLDELCRMAAQQMLAVALEAERRAYLDAHAGWWTGTVTGWWWATGICLSGG